MLYFDACCALIKELKPCFNWLKIIIPDKSNVIFGDIKKSKRRTEEVLIDFLSKGSI